MIFSLRTYVGSLHLLSASHGFQSTPSGHDSPHQEWKKKPNSRVAIYGSVHAMLSHDVSGGSGTVISEATSLVQKAERNPKSEVCNARDEQAH